MVRKLVGLLVLVLLAGSAVEGVGPLPQNAAKKQQLAELAREANQLRQQGKVKEAITAVERMMALERVVYGHDHVEVAGSLSWLAKMHEDLEDYKVALGYRKEAMEMQERLHGKGHWRVRDAQQEVEDTELLSRLTAQQKRDLQRAAQLTMEGHELRHAGKFKAALPRCRQALDIRKEVLGEKHPSYAASLNNLASLYFAMGDHQSALALSRQALDISKEVLGENHPDYATSLNNLALLCSRMGDHKSALPLYRQALDIRKVILGENHPDYAHSLSNLALWYRTMGDQKSALPLSRQALDIRKEVLGEKHPSYAASLDNLAALYFDIGDQKSALPLFRQALAIHKETLGEKHPSYAASLSNLAGLYYDIGDQKSAFALFRQTLDIRKEVLGEKHPSYAASLDNLASFYFAIGDRSLALPLCRQALDIRKEVLGEKHPSYAASLSNLSAMYFAMGDQKSALPLCRQALDIRKEVLGEKHPSYAMSLNNFAALHRNMGDQQSALPLFRQALDILKNVLGEKHPDYAEGLDNLAAVYFVMGDQKSALPLCRQALDIRKEVLGEKHPRYAANLDNLASLYRKMGDHKLASPLYEESLAIRKYFLDATASVQSERQQLAALDLARPTLECRLSLELPHEQATVAYGHVLTWKGSVFARQRRQRLAARVISSGNSEVAALVGDLEMTSRQIAMLAMTTPAPAQAKDRLARLAKLTQEKEDLERRLSERNAIFRAALKQPAVTPDSVVASLPEGVALVDYLVYWHTPPKGNGQNRLVAFVLRRGEPVRPFDLGPADRVREQVQLWRGNIRGGGSGGKAGEWLREKVWLPIEPALGKATTVLVSPDGPLSGLSFAALPGTKADTYLIEERAVAVLPVPQLLAELLAPLPKEGRLPPSLLLVGDVDYDNKEVALASIEDRSAPRGSLQKWPKLMATGAEVASVKDSFASLFKTGKVVDLRREEARKKAVREAMVRNRYVHLATHGFFAPESVVSALGEKEAKNGLFGEGGVRGWHPLLLSGVVLAGANREAAPGEEDGILTALEVCEMDLSKCELAVLSACETGLGKEAGGEGVLGLQRAFQVAGCRSVVTSLWAVDDSATRALMTAFYASSWTRSKSRVESLRQAQLTLLNEDVKRSVERGMVRREHLVENPKRTPPFYWAAFVLSGDWR